MIGSKESITATMIRQSIRSVGITQISKLRLKNPNWSHVLDIS